jgi:poly-beta-1,6-N-acetyl-D-glucosamine synthase
MITIFLITGFLILLYLVYPFWLMIVPTEKGKEVETEDITGVSLVLLSYNGKEYLKDKVSFLLKELSCFQCYELIIIDDFSNDGSREILNNFNGINNVRIINKTCRKGIPDSMNTGVRSAKYDYIIFCDQRQKLSDNLIQRIVQPLKCKDVGAVSGCVFHLDQENRFSILRKIENFIKCKESEAGSLIGVYGPFYAINKHCYRQIPVNIILDDLYLSLRILKTKQIRLLENCHIIDENFSTLNDYKRARRYLSGFLQIMKEKSLIRELSIRQKIMLTWHKYLRLMIPVFIFLSYISTGALIVRGIEYVVLFSVFTILGLISFIPGRFRLMSLVRINILYFIALFDVFYKDIIKNKQVDVNSGIKNPDPENMESEIQGQIR